MLSRSVPGGSIPGSISSPTVVDDWRKCFDVCNGKVGRELDAHVARMTRPGDRQKREMVWQRDERKAAGPRQRRGEPSQGGQKGWEVEQRQFPLTPGLGGAGQTFFERVFFPIGSQSCQKD